MKSIIEYIYENINIFESSTGLSLSVDSNIKKLLEYLKKYFNNKKCILPDNKQVIDKFDLLKEWFINDNDTSKPFFYLKNNSHNYLCINGNIDLSDDELNTYGITKKGNNEYYLEGIKAKLQTTHKKDGRINVKIWPSKWGIIKGKYDETNIDFKQKGAYLIELNDISSIKNDLYESFKNTGELPDEIINIFNENTNIKEYLNKISKEDYFKKYKANILSEPIAILSVIENINNIQDDIRKSFLNNDLGDLIKIVIPISENWTDADFYITFEKIPNELIPISVKSGNIGGHKSTILNCIGADKEYKKQYIQITNDIKQSCIDIFKEIIPNLNGKIDKITNKNIDNISLYTLNMLEHFCRQDKMKNEPILIETFNELINLVKDSEIYQGLKLISTNKATNIIDKIFCALFNSSNKCMDRIKNVINTVKAQHKITLDDNGNIKYKLQNENLHNLKLYPLHGGKVSAILIINKDTNLIEDIETKQISSNGQWLGYSF